MKEEDIRSLLKSRKREGRRCGLNVRLPCIALVPVGGVASGCVLAGAASSLRAGM